MKANTKKTQLRTTAGILREKRFFPSAAVMPNTVSSTPKPYIARGANTVAASAGYSPKHISPIRTSAAAVMAMAGTVFRRESKTTRTQKAITASTAAISQKGLKSDRTRE